MKKLLLLLVLVISTTSIAQMRKTDLPKGNISGKVIDKTTNEPLPYVNIIVRDMAKKVITGGITDDNGLFKIKDIPEGKSIVEIQFIGYKTVSKEINITSGNRNLELDTIALEEDLTTLDEVEVRAETSTVVQKVDRKVINVGKDLTSAGTTASELLNNVQSVSVDSQTGAISLRGNENVRVLVDGKPTNISAAQLLKQIPSSSIKSIELITNPSAKYNPEGMSGIINIILNKNANMGFNGSIDTGVTAGHYVRYNASTNMNYKTGDVNFFVNYGYNGGDNYNYGFVDRPAADILQDFKFINENRSHLVKVGADIYVNDKNTLSLYTTQNWYNGGGSGSTIITENNAITSNAYNIQLQDNHTAAYNLNYKIDFEKKGHNLEFEANYSETNGVEDSSNTDSVSPTDGSLNYLTDITNDQNSTQVNLDYTNPVSENGKLEIGLEFRQNKTDNDNVTDQSGNPNSNFSYDRNIYSGYVNYNHKLGKLNMQLGARLEQYDIEGFFNQEGEGSAKVTDEIFSVYPSAFFTYDATEKDQFQVSYSRRVDRPGIGQVNPIREWSTPLITSIGNPNLRPQFTNSIEFNFTHQIKGGSFTLGSFYRNINDVISRVTYKDPNDPNDVRQILSHTNFEDTDAYGLEFSANLKLAKWWRANLSTEVYTQKQFGTVDLNDPNAEPLEVNADTFNARISNSFTATEDLRFQLFAMYRGPQDGIQFNRKTMWMVNTGATYNVLDGKGTLSFRVNDIFKGMKFAFDSNNPYVQNGQFNWESQTVYFGFNYRFGSGKNKAKQRRRRDSNEKQGGGGFI
ncbi:outer membrane receptor protein involved in Fe transport [Tenacibaculum adriaticum]|uniref:Outer membrane receptor protein involved in Fe transport n=1 Tax=Tenacibaculum adriaticum TaxID=413713 RepID=A0A5S5DQE1_9FLAO|nr:TonB-dependent receptor [Tenacibaculum adriaticum]TYP97052.1 outer membrane receptor protein involved in Fe transport [Tenacibaculum adriaticum]